MQISRFAFLYLILACIAVSSEALYSKSSPVRVLDDATLGDALKEDGVWLVEFFAPWCGHCKNLKPEWEKSAKALKGIISVAAVDVDVNKAAASEYQIQSLPTIKLLVVQDGKIVKKQDYNSERNAKSIVQAGMKLAQDTANARLGIKSSSKGKASGSGSKAKASSSGGFYAGTSVQELTSATFKEVSKSKDMWFIEFYAPWCGHCKNLKPAWIEAANQLKDKVKFGAVNCDDDANRPICSKFGVKGFPTLKFFKTGSSTPTSYNEGRDTKALVEYGLRRWKKTQVAPIVELVSQHVFEEKCTGNEKTPGKQLCVIAVLPDLLDTQAAGRVNYINTLREVSSDNAGSSYAYLWTSAGTQAALESNFDIGGYGYPALVAYAPKKGAYISLKGGFKKSEISNLLSSLRSSKTKVTPVRGELSEIVTVKAWDGKDAPAEIEEEMSLDEIMGDAKAEL